MGQIEVTDKDQAPILAMLGDTPPLTVLFSGSKDQRREIWRLKGRYLFLKEKLIAYFNGQADLNIEGLSQFDQESIEAEKDCILALYALIQGSWGDLVQVSESAGVFFSDGNIFSPGDWIAAYIEASAADHYERVTAPYFRFTPSEGRTQIKALKDALKLLDSQEYSQLRTPGKRKVDKAVALVRKHNKDSRSADGLHFALDCCRKLAKDSSKHSAIRRRLDAYNDISAKQLALTCSELHPRKARKGWEIVKGERSEMGTKGGVAVLNKTTQ